MKNLALMVIAVAVGTGISTDIPPKDEGQENGYFYDGKGLYGGDGSHYWCILKIDGELTAIRSLNETICEIITRARHVFDVLMHYQNGTREKYDHCKRMTFPEFESAMRSDFDMYWVGHCLIVTPEDDYFEDKKKSFFLSWYGYLILVLVILVTLFLVYKFRRILCWGIFDLGS